jgi:hypothetical protein
MIKRSGLASQSFYRFKSIDVSNIGPFKEDQSLNFKNPFTLVIGDNCSGKTSIAKKLESILQDDLIDPSGLEKLSFLIFLTQDDIAKKNYAPAEILVTFGVEKELFDITVNELLEDLRFDSRCYSRLINKNYPKATGEVIIMNLIINFALRKILRLDLPFVIDGIASVLDTDYLKLFINFLRKNYSQVILLSIPDSRYQQFGLNSDYYLNIDSKTKKSNILITDRDK